MDDLDRPNQTEALGRRAAAAMHADVERRSDVDDALSRVQHGSGATMVSLTSDASRARRLLPAWIGAAAAVAVVATGSAAFLLTRDDGISRVVPADTTAPADTTSADSTAPTNTTEDAGAATTQPENLAPVTTAAPTPASTVPSLPATDVDALAGLTPPAPLDAFQVPAMLPSTPVADPALVRLTGFSTPIEAVTGLHQTWASVDGRILTISTAIGGSIQRLGDVPIEVWPWDSAALVSSMSDGFAELVLRDPSGEVSLWASGFTGDQLTTIARSMFLAEGRWWLGPDAPSDLVRLHEGWGRTSFATRMLQWDDAGRQGEVLVTIGMPDTIRTVPDFALTVVDSINGAPALVTDLPGGAAISWSPAPDVVVLVGITGTVDEVIELARSMTFVDVSTWNAAGIADTSPADGCNSYFFC